METEAERRMGKKMTEENRRKLCERLRRLDLQRDVGEKAADEIERLAEENRRLKVTPFGIESAAHAIRLVENNQRSLDHCRLLARAAFVGAFP